jgi:hypothetical protein
MTTFDASTGQAANSVAIPDPLPPVEELPELGSMLDALQEQLEAREIDNTTTVEVPGMDLRLVCQIDFPYALYAKWQKAALPSNKRNGRKLNPLDLDQAMVAVFVLLGTCTGMEYRATSGEWLPMTTPAGQGLTPNSTEFLARFNQVDAKVFIRKLYGSDANLMRAADRVTSAAGWSDDAEDDDDPLV